MKKIFVINGGKKFAHSKGKLNETITQWDKDFFNVQNGFELQFTELSIPYETNVEIEKFLWADVIIYHFPIWWMYIPFQLKEYLDNVLTAGHRKGMYYSDGRKAENPQRNYGHWRINAGHKIYGYDDMECTRNGFYTARRILSGTQCR
ncbi:NAD(P)H-dependent oxidoreductase [Flavobacterium reichenbachii]|uniref:NAD(P)H-dependent oxidoreductase n=1 Tax=Flavobacterium reichenbachii TaxID=362418 RepID=UPI000AB2EF6B|nr:NAD(P)H-dependent oxidoreductase [Flavobacterium reichenbachii]